MGGNLVAVRMRNRFLSSTCLCISVSIACGDSGDGGGNGLIPGDGGGATTGGADDGSDGGGGDDGMTGTGGGGTGSDSGTGGDSGGSGTGGTDSGGTDSGSDGGSDTSSDGGSDTGTTSGDGGTTSGGGTTTGTGGTSGTGTGTATTGGGTSTAGTGCVPTETPEVTCDNLDNDCNGLIDDVDLGSDGFCDCLDIGIIGDTGFAPSADFEAWLQSKGTAVTRTLLAGTIEVVDDTLLADYELLLVDRIERPLTANETAAIESFVKDDGNGVITLIGYNFDNNDPAPERDRANTALSGFGLAYTGPYLHAGGANNVTPTFDPTHAISMGITDVNYHGGMAMVDSGGQGVSEIFATVPGGDAGLAHQTTGDGGRVIVWGDEWITFDSDWAGYADVAQFWQQMVEWARPREYCILPG